jgi:hypothetical protein
VFGLELGGGGEERVRAVPNDVTWVSVGLLVLDLPEKHFPHNPNNRSDQCANMLNCLDHCWSGVRRQMRQKRSTLFRMEKAIDGLFTEAASSSDNDAVGGRGSA